TGRLMPEARALVESWAANPRAWMPPEA
ncbi:MAG: orotate phosphoribosyltransferase, partial [Candidatus Thermofonsia Clade 3 bacterium]